MNARAKPLFGPEEMAREPVAFPKLTDDEMAAARACGRTETYRAGDDLITVGQRPVDCFVILRGEVDVLDTSRGQERLIITHGAGAILGDINAFAGRSAVATCRCVDETEAVRLCVSAFLRRRELLTAAGFEGLRLFGPGTDRATLHLSEFMHRNGVAHHWLDITRADDLALLPQHEMKKVSCWRARRPPRPASGRWNARRVRWKRPAQGCSWQGIAARARPSAWPSRWATGRWP